MAQRCEVLRFLQAPLVKPVLLATAYSVSTASLASTMAED